MPPEPRLTFFTDASIGRRIVPTALRAAGLEVVVHDDRFSPGTLDEEWLAEAGRLDWLVLTKDNLYYGANLYASLKAKGVWANGIDPLRACNRFQAAPGVPRKSSGSARWPLT